MKKLTHAKTWRILAAVCALALAALWAAPGRTQTAEVKEKPPMYTWVGFWSLPRAQWADMEKFNASRQAAMEKALADGTIVGFGYDNSVVHHADGFTHDSWWSSMSLAGVMNVLEQAYKAGTPTTPVLGSATKHADMIFVSRYYNWRAGSWKDAYTRLASYKLKADAPNDAVDTLSKDVYVPVLEKLLADGTLHEYEIDTEAVHTEAPGMFWVEYIAANAEALDKASAAVREAGKANPLRGPAVASMVDFSEHRDELARSVLTYK